MLSFRIRQNFTRRRRRPPRYSVAPYFLTDPYPNAQFGTAVDGDADATTMNSFLPS